MVSVYQKIHNYNAKRNQNFIQFKYNALAENPHRFFRGTNHLFVEYLAKEKNWKNAPFSWACGDLHIENFGSYKGANRLIYFDLNDFDEAAIAPCTIDLIRLCTDIFLIGNELEFSLKESEEHCQLFLESYKQTILQGHTSRIEEPIATGLIKYFFEQVRQRKRKQFLRNRLIKQNGRTLIKCDFRKYYPLSKSEKQLVEKSLLTWVKENNLDKDFFSFVDAAYRIAGTGSLGLNRYCVLIRGNGKPNYILLDIKQAEKTPLSVIFTKNQNKYKSQAHKVVHAQKRMQDTVPACISTIKLNNEFYVIKEHQPTEDKFSVERFKNKETDLKKLLNELGQLVAWAQLRSSGIDGTTSADELITFAQKYNFKNVVNLAKKMCTHVLIDYQEYIEEYKAKRK